MERQQELAANVRYAVTDHDGRYSIEHNDDKTLSYPSSSQARKHVVELDYRF